MKNLCLVYVLLLAPTMALARKANFIESHLLRLSSQQNPTQWLLPFNQVKNPTIFEFNLMGSMQKDTFDLYEDIQSKKQERIQNRLEESFGEPYDVSAKVNLGFRYKDFSQFFSTNGGAVLLATDPVFPELKGFLFHDYAGSSAYLFRPHPRLILKPQITYGARKTLDRAYTVGDLVDKGLNVKFNKIPYVGFTEISLLSILSLSEWGQVLFQLNSFPLMKSEYEYWDTFLGYKTPNFLKNSQWFISEFSFFGGYSPMYGGDYDVSRTYKVGAKTLFWDWIGLDLFTMDDFYPASILSFKFAHLTAEFFTFERAYDDFGQQKTRDYGFNLKATW